MDKTDKQVCQEIKDDGIYDMNHSLDSIHMMHKDSIYYHLRKASILKRELFLKICEILKIDKACEWLNNALKKRG